MTPKKKTTAQRADKRKKMDNTRFRSIQHFERYNQFFDKAPIIQEWFVDLVDLKDYFILGFFQDKGWEKLLNDLPRGVNHWFGNSMPMPFYGRMK